MMPKVDGFTVLDRLRKSEKAQKIPVIMCTAKGQREDVVQAMHTGANDYIVKPFSKQVLLDKVKKLIGEAEPAPKKAKPAKATPGDATPPKPAHPIEPAEDEGAPP
jgi:DNA-binding response OmpR family regulator